MKSSVKVIRSASEWMLLSVFVRVKVCVQMLEFGPKKKKLYNKIIIFCEIGFMCHRETCLLAQGKMKEQITDCIMFLTTHLFLK